MANVTFRRATVKMTPGRFLHEDFTCRVEKSLKHGNRAKIALNDLIMSFKIYMVLFRVEITSLISWNPLFRKTQKTLLSPIFAVNRT